MVPIHFLYGITYPEHISLLEMFVSNSPPVMKLDFLWKYYNQQVVMATNTIMDFPVLAKYYMHDAKSKLVRISLTSYDPIMSVELVGHMVIFNTSEVGVILYQYGDDGVEFIAGFPNYLPDTGNVVIIRGYIKHYLSMGIARLMLSFLYGMPEYIMLACYKALEEESDYYLKHSLKEIALEDFIAWRNFIYDKLPWEEGFSYKRYQRQAFPWLLNQFSTYYSYLLWKPAHASSYYPEVVVTESTSKVEKPETDLKDSALEAKRAKDRERKRIERRLKGASSKVGRPSLSPEERKLRKANRKRRWRNKGSLNSF